MTNKEKGKQLEIYVAEKLQEVFKENPPIRPTKASGGGSRNTEIGDILSQNVFTECKSHKGKFFSRRVWERFINSLPFGSKKTPFYVAKIETEVLVMLYFDDLCRLLENKKCMK